MALAVDAEHGAVGVHHRDRVEERLAAALEEAHGDDDAQLGGQAAEARDRRVLLQRSRQREVPRVLRDAEVRRLEELLQQHDLRARPAASRTSPSAVARLSSMSQRAGELRRRQSHLARHRRLPVLVAGPRPWAPRCKHGAGEARACSPAPSVYSADRHPAIPWYRDDVKTRLDTL